MITYGSSGGIFGLQMLFRFHGSAVLKSCTPSVLSSILYFLLYKYMSNRDEELLDHPYPLGALVAAFSFLLIFRANFAYNRYWDANTSIHTMHSKWLDAATEMAAFHLQSDCYASIRPPSFGQQMKSMAVEPSPVKKRQPHHPMSPEQLENDIDGRMKQQDDTLHSPSGLSRPKSFARRIGTRSRVTSSVRSASSSPPSTAGGTSRISGDRDGTDPMSKAPRTVLLSSSSITSSNRHRSVRNKNSTDFFDPHHADANGSTPRATFWSHVQQRLQEGHMGDVPVPLFLEAFAHLLSLLSAVALSTLRNDLEGAESPLAEFRPNAPWPFVDPDRYTSKIRTRWDQSEHKSYTIVRYLLGLSRTDAARRLYNKGRPFRVIGSVSDDEIKALQAARGPQAKVTLISFWLQELVSREHLAGLTGSLGPPIISRVYQLISEGMTAYNQARKVAYIPFPFPHAQLTTLFVLVILGFIPLLMLTYVDNNFFGFVWNWLTVMCFTGLHEVARELENPFQNVPNEIPLNNYQAQFNEGLMIMFYGYHPDAYWLEEEQEKQLDGSDTSSKSSINHQGSQDETNTPKAANQTIHLEEKKANKGPQIPEEVPAPPLSGFLKKPMLRKELPIQMATWDDSMLLALSTSNDEVPYTATGGSETGTDIADNLQ